VTDTVQSPCIDAGDPAAAYGYEPEPNGDRLNMGAYGGTTEASKTYWPPPGDIQPDMLVRTPAATWVGDGIYNSTGADQTISRQQGTDETRLTTLRVQNDGAAPDSFLVTGTGSTAQMTVHYFDRATGGTDITSQVTGAGWTGAALSPGIFRDFRVETTLTSAANGNSSRTTTVTAHSVTKPKYLDVVKVVTICSPVLKPDLLIRVLGDPSYLGDGIYNSDGTNQTATKSSAVKVTYQVRIQNDGNTPDQYKIVGVAGSESWTVKYRSDTSADITYACTRGGWLTPVMPRGTARTLTVEVTPTSLAASGASKTVTMTARSKTNLAYLDVVKAVTTKP
jgi:hypothetical protein